MSTTRLNARYNPMAIWALAFVVLFSPLAVIFGSIARMQIARSGERGGALATWAIVLGFLRLAFYVARLLVAWTTGWDLGFGNSLYWLV